MKAMNDSATATPPIKKTKIGATLITISRAEGPAAECFETKHTTWADAELRIKNICATAPQSGGYEKCDFTIVFANLETYSGRYDAAHPTSLVYEGSLSDHVRNHLTFYAGLRCPAHMTDEKYNAFLDQREPGDRADFLAFLTTYALEDLPVETTAPAVDKPAMLPVYGNTFPVRGLLRTLGGTWDADLKRWSVPADKHAEAMAAIDRFTPKAAPAPAPAPKPVQAATPAPKPAPAAKPTTKKAKAPKLPPNALERRLQALLTGAELLRQDCPEGSRARSELFFVIEHIKTAIEGK